MTVSIDIMMIEVSVLTEEMHTPYVLKKSTQTFHIDISGESTPSHAFASVS
jgi:hypothetical protein